MNFFRKKYFLRLYVILRSLIPNHLVNNFKHLPTAIIANFIYRFPSKKIKLIGVTGTNGKTTTASIIYHLLHSANKKVALISTVEVKIGNKSLDTGLHVTSPDPLTLQKLLRSIVDHKIEYVVLETTSHGFSQYRLWGINFEIGVFTNLTPEHLLYHKTMQSYAKAKSVLFKNSKISILNKDNNFFDFFESISRGKVISYGYKNGDYQASKIVRGFVLPGKFNAMNATAAYIAALKLGLSDQEIQNNLKTFPGVLGRMQTVYNNNFKIIVDFAHTPDALEKALQTIKNMFHEKGSLISVFGCAGLRDKTRRKMGEVSAKLANITIITAEDPRLEGVEKISKEIADWAKKTGAVEVKKDFFDKKHIFDQHIYINIFDRQEAINFAIKIARKGDIIGVFGKGHEKSLAINNQEIPWSDQEAVKKALSLHKAI